VAAGPVRVGAERRERMKRLAATALTAVCACAIAGVAYAQKVNIDYDKGVDFSRFTSYQWAEGQPAQSPLVHKRIVNAIEKQLASKGWTKVEPSDALTATAVVVYYAGVEAERQLNAWGSGPRWSGIATANVETILTGQLVVDVYDTATGELVWRGFASDTVSDDQEKNEKRLNEAVGKLFKQFPPGRAARSSQR
jgi:hypothetical protein